MIAIDRAHLAGPAFVDTQITFRRAGELFAIGVDDGQLDAKERSCGRAGLCGRGTGQRGDHDAASFGLPPGVDDGAAAFRRFSRDTSAMPPG